MTQESVFVVVSGGVVQDSPSFVEVIDFDNLLPDCYTVGDAARGWDALSDAAKRYVKSVYPESFSDIQDRIAEDEELPTPIAGYGAI